MHLSLLKAIQTWCHHFWTWCHLPLRESQREDVTILQGGNFIWICTEWIVGKCKIFRKKKKHTRSYKLATNLPKRKLFANCHDITSIFLQLSQAYFMPKVRSLATQDYPDSIRKCSPPSFPWLYFPAWMVVVRTDHGWITVLAQKVDSTAKCDPSIPTLKATAQRTLVRKYQLLQITGHLLQHRGVGGCKARWDDSLS